MNEPIDSPFVKTPEEWASFVASHPDHDHYVAWFRQTGFSLVAATVEYYDFPPLTSANDAFCFNLVGWRDVLWSSFSTPKTNGPRVAAIADALAMEVSEYPPSHLRVQFRDAGIVVSVPTDLSEDQVKEIMRNRGFPAEHLGRLSGLEAFPGSLAGSVRALEPAPHRLTAPLSPQDEAGVIKREAVIREVFVAGP